jgi:predicted O-methyltransferase YrrM
VAEGDGQEGAPVEIDERISAYLRHFPEHEDEAQRAARARSEEADLPAVPPETGALLRFFARLVRARHVVEIGSGGGYSALWLLGGMDARGSLTTIEIDADHLALAQRSFADAKVSDRTRCMHGAALAVLPKLADDSYDIVFLDAVKAEYPDYLVEAKRLLRPGGLLLADNVLWSGRVADPEATDDDTEAMREFNESVRADHELHGAILPVGDGLLAAVYTPEEEQ